MNSELILTTYNSPRALWLTLLSAAGQTRRPNGICVADDGSGAETAQVIHRFQKSFPDLPLRHVWHEDRGFRKTVILNKAIASSKAEYLVFTDGDCLLSPGFIARHTDLARIGRFCCGSLIRLPAEATAAVTDEAVRDRSVFTRGWLRRHDALDRPTTWLKATPLSGPVQNLLDLVSPVRKTFSGCNASAHRSAILAVNGFDETMVYGGLDKELGVRLVNSGLRGRHLRFTAPVLHLDHPRSYRDAEAIRRQREMILEARRSGKAWTEHGIEKSPASAAAV